MRLGITADGTIEAQWIVVGHEKSLMGFVLEDVLFHL